jgi:phage gpG-like protein
MLNITVTGDKELIARFEAMPGKLRQALTTKVSTLALRLEDRVKRKLTNDVLHVRSGDLRRSIFSEVQSNATEVIGKVASSGDVKYAAIQEFGGKTSAHVIEAKNGGALAFMFGGKQAFFKKVNHPGSVIPERSYLRSSLADMRDEIVEGLEEAVALALKT